MTGSQLHPSTHRRFSQASFLDDIQLNLGPIEQLKQFFEAAQRASQSLGVHIRFATFEEVMVINANNQASWRAMIPTFNPQLSELDADTSFCLVYENSENGIVGIQCCRLFDWPKTTMYDELTSLRFYYARPEADSMPDEKCVVSVERTNRISGPTYFSGGVWYHPEHRGKRLGYILPRVCRAIALTRWNVDLYTTMIQDKVLVSDLHLRAGWTNFDWAVENIGSPMGNIRFAFLWLTREEVIQDLAEFAGGRNRQLNEMLGALH
ncbi:MAG: hypothetical protein AAF709_03710 [Pseudomonadota bacterium]